MLEALKSTMSTICPSYYDYYTQVVCQESANNAICNEFFLINKPDITYSKHKNIDGIINQSRLQNSRPNRWTVGEEDRHN